MSHVADGEIASLHPIPVFQELSVLRIPFFVSECLLCLTLPPLGDAVEGECYNRDEEATADPGRNADFGASG